MAIKMMVNTCSSSVIGTTIKQKNTDLSISLLEAARKGVDSGREMETHISKVLMWKEFGFTPFLSEHLSKKIVEIFNGTFKINLDEAARLPVLLLKAAIISKKVNIKTKKALFNTLHSTSQSEKLKSFIEDNDVQKQEGSLKTNQVPIENKFKIPSHSAALELFQNTKLVTIYDDFKVVIPPKLAEEIDHQLNMENGKMASSNNSLHTLLSRLYLLKINPFRRSGFVRGALKGEQPYIDENGKKYPIYHLGLDRSDLRAKYIVDGKNIILLEIYYHK